MFFNVCLHSRSFPLRADWQNLVLKLNLYFKLVPFRLLIHIILGSWIHRQYFVLAFMYVILECMIEFPEEMARKKRI